MFRLFSILQPQEAEPDAAADAYLAPGLRKARDIVFAQEARATEAGKIDAVTPMVLASVRHQFLVGLFEGLVDAAPPPAEVVDSGVKDPARLHLVRYLVEHEAFSPKEAGKEVAALARMKDTDDDPLYQLLRKLGRESLTSGREDYFLAMLEELGKLKPA